MRKSLAVFLLASFAACAPLSALAGPVTVPAGLNPGDQYRLVFATSTSTDAISSNIADYNAFVTTAANAEPRLAALGTTWSAIASTSAVAAEDNTDTNPSGSVGLPIYQLAGLLVAHSNAEFWSLDTHGPWEDEHGGDGPVWCWTGTAPDGTQADHLGGVGISPDDPHLYATLGYNGYNFNHEWISRLSYALHDYLGQTNNFSLYAMSGVLTVPVPEPSTTVLACLAAAGMAFVAIRKHRSR